MASYIVIEPKYEDGLVCRFDKTASWEELSECLFSEELPSMNITYGSHPLSQSGSTGKGGCSGCTSHDEDDSKEQIYFNFELKNNKLKIDDEASEEFDQILKKFKLSEFANGRVTSDPMSRVEINQARKCVRRIKYLMLKPEHIPMYNLLNTYEPCDLEDNLFSINKDLFEVTEEKPAEGMIYVKEKENILEAENYFKFFLILTNEEVNNNLPTIVEVLKFCQNHMMEE